MSFLSTAVRDLLTDPVSFIWTRKAIELTRIDLTVESEENNQSLPGIVEFRRSIYEEGGFFIRTSKRSLSSIFSCSTGAETVLPCLAISLEFAGHETLMMSFSGSKIRSLFGVKA